jgi:intein/homing endonuclease
MMNFVDNNTAWFKHRHKKDSTMHKRASFVRNVNGVQVEQGYKSEIMGITLKNDPQKARGKAAKLILFEEGGKFPQLKTVWQIARPSVEQDGEAFGLMIAYGTGGCLTAGNKVWTNDGNLIDIEDVNKESGILGFSGSSISKENITWLQPSSKKECIKITTNTRRVIECSTDHPILTANYKGTNFRGNIKGNSFVEASRLNLKNKIAVIDEIPIFGNNRMWEPRVIGWLIGDGSYGKYQQPRISNCEEEINNYIENELNHTIQIQRLTEEGKTYRETALLGYNDHLRELGIYGQTKLNKTLPINIHLYSKEDLQEFVGGLFDTDGYVAIRRNKNRNTWIGEISISSASESLLNELRFLLQKFGIHGRIRERLPRKTNPKDKNPWYEFTIADTISLLRFINNIKLFPKEKQNRLNLLKEQFEKIKPHTEYEGYRYEEIINIEYTGIKPVYNLTAGITHTYIGNGIITHNTEEADYTGLKDLFYEPLAYNCLPIRNVWDEGEQDRACGFFVPQSANIKRFMDVDGNTDFIKSNESILQERDVVIENASDRTAIDRHICEQPLTPAEATLNISTNIFPKRELIQHLATIRNSKSLSDLKQVGELYMDSNGVVKFQQNPKLKSLMKYRIPAGNSKEGALCIWEHPPADTPYGLYVAGCIIPGEKVMTDKGLMSVEDIDYSNKLINKDGEIVDIKTLLRYEKDNCDIYKIKPQGSLRTTSFTGEHPILIKDDFVKAESLKVGNVLKIPNRYNVEKSDYKNILYNYLGDEINISNERFWWFLGLWLGDGFNNLNRNSRDIYVAFGKDQSNESSNYSLIISEIFNRKTTVGLSNGGNTRRFTHKKLYELLETEFGKYSYGKRIPEWVKYAPKEFKKYFILGYLDSDGSAFLDRGKLRVTFTSVNLELLESLQDIMYSINTISSITVHSKAGICTFNNKSYNTRECYRLSIINNTFKNIIPENTTMINSRKMLTIIQTSSNLRKQTGEQTVVSSCGKYIFLKIKSIEKAKYTGTVYNFECESHTYMCRNIVTHNCDPLNLAVRYIIVRIG